MSFLSAGYIQKGEDQVSPGDVTGFDVGFVSPATNRDLQLQGGLLMVWQSSDTFRDAGLLSRENRIDSIRNNLLGEVAPSLPVAIADRFEFRKHSDRQPLGEASFIHFEYVYLSCSTIGTDWHWVFC